jgi:hypothetical protein
MPALGSVTFVLKGKAEYRDRAHSSSQVSIYISFTPVHKTMANLVVLAMNHRNAFGYQA